MATLRSADTEAEAAEAVETEAAEAEAVEVNPEENAATVLGARVRGQNSRKEVREAINRCMLLCLSLFRSRARDR